jgi:hypothetical protein
MGNVKKFLDSTGLTTLTNFITTKFVKKEDLQTAVNVIDQVKADKVSPTFTGVPQAPTAMPGTATD